MTQRIDSSPIVQILAANTNLAESCFPELAKRDLQLVLTCISNDPEELSNATKRIEQLGYSPPIPEQISDLSHLITSIDKGKLNHLLPESDSPSTLKPFRLIAAEPHFSYNFIADTPDARTLRQTIALITREESLSDSVKQLARADIMLLIDYGRATHASPKQAEQLSAIVTQLGFSVPTVSEIQTIHDIVLKVENNSPTTPSLYIPPQASEAVHIALLTFRVFGENSDLFRLASHAPNLLSEYRGLIAASKSSISDSSIILGIAHTTAEILKRQLTVPSPEELSDLDQALKTTPYLPAAEDDWIMVNLKDPAGSPTTGPTLDLLDQRSELGNAIDKEKS